MSYICYGTDNTKRVIKANDIHEAYQKLVKIVGSYFLKNYSYKIERLY